MVPTMSDAFDTYVMLPHAAFVLVAVGLFLWIEGTDPSLACLPSPEEVQSHQPHLSLHPTLRHTHKECSSFQLLRDGASECSSSIKGSRVCHWTVSHRFRPVCQQLILRRTMTVECIWLIACAYLKSSSVDSRNSQRDQEERAHCLLCTFNLAIAGHLNCAELLLTDARLEGRLPVVPFLLRSSQAEL